MTHEDDGAVWLIRHAESEWNALGRWQGQADPALSPRGLEQAQGLAVTLAGVRIDALVASDLRRARETAEILARALGVEPRFDPRLRERDLGAWAGLTSDEIEARWPDALARVRARDPEVRPGGGESIRDVARRARGFFAELVAGGQGGRVAVVAHGGLIRSLCDVPPIANATIVRTTFVALLANGD